MEDLAQMRVPEQYVRAGKLAREMRGWILENVSVPQTSLEIATSIEEEIARRGGQPAFPTGIGINGVTAHFSPQEDDQTRIGSGDVVKIDYGVHFDGYIADTAVTMTQSPEYQLLMEATKRALEAAISVVKRDPRTGEIGKAIEAAANREGFKTINNLSGHTLEQYTVHAGKSIPNVYAPNQPVLRRDEVFAIEPFLTLGTAAGYVVDDPKDTRVTIYSLIMRKRTGVKELDALVDHIWNLRKSLPFTPRWFTKEFGRDRLPKLLAELERRRIVRGYRTLVEASNAPVAQFEHTMKLEGNSLVILT
ncbi:MAG TPA: type II methionyl aminopeptidase [Nitrososphaerales archaeon]|nr:type II methionyl aminopeptidase [Nitrososphaerales archaeon]